MSHHNTKRSKLRIETKNFLFTLAGVLMASIGLKGFLLPNDFIDGGVIGISLLTEILTKVNLSILIVLLNIPFIIIGIRQFSMDFAIRTALAIIALSLIAHSISIPTITNDKLLIAVFGGFFLGAGTGLAMRGGCVIDGTEILAIYLSRLSPFSVGEIIMGFNVLIFATAAVLINIETAMYAMLTYLAATKTIDFIVHGVEEFTGVSVVTENSEQVRDMIVNKLNYGVTLINGKKGFGKKGEANKAIEIVYTIVTRLELTRLKNEILSIDPDAFIIETSINDTHGGMIRKKGVH